MKKWIVKIIEDGTVKQSLVTEAETAKDAEKKFKEMCKNIITNKTKFEVKLQQ